MKSRSHIYMANILLKEIKSGKLTITDDTGKEQTYFVPEIVLKALSTYPAMFRAGAVGPDFYPDMILGQMIIHPNYSGDWLDIMKDELMKIPYATDDQLKALSFYLGYTIHYAGDAFTHCYVNKYAKGWFPSIFEDIIDKFKNPSIENIKTATENIKKIIRHICVEAYMDDYIKEKQKKSTDDIYCTTLEIPTSYLRSCFISYDNVNKSVDNIIKKIYYANDKQGEYDEIEDNKYNFSYVYAQELHTNVINANMSNTSAYQKFIKLRNDYIDEWLNLWNDIANDSLTIGIKDAISNKKVDLLTKAAGIVAESEKDFKKAVKIIETIYDIADILDSIYIPVLDEIWNLFTESIKGIVKETIYNMFLYEFTHILTGKGKKELSNFDDCIEAIKKAFLNVKLLLRNDLLFEEYNGKLPEILKDEFGNNFGKKSTKSNNFTFAAFKNALNMGKLCLIGNKNLNDILDTYNALLQDDEKVKNPKKEIYNDIKTQYGINKIRVVTRTSGGTFAPTNKIVYIGVLNKDNEKMEEKPLDNDGLDFVVGTKGIYNINFDKTYLLDEINGFSLRVNKANQWRFVSIDIIDPTTNCQIAYAENGIVKYANSRKTSYTYTVPMTFSSEEYDNMDSCNIVMVDKLLVEIKTSDSLYSGTNDDVYFYAFYKNGRKETKKLLDKSWHDDFERGSRETYIVSIDPTRIKDIDYFGICKKAGKIADAWKVDSVAVSDIMTGRSLAYKDINKKVYSDIVEIPLKTNNSLFECLNIDPLIPINKFVVTIKTTNKQWAGTDNNIYFKVNYYDNSGELQSETKKLDKSWYNDFERDDIDSYVVEFKNISILPSKIESFEIYKKGNDDWFVDFVVVSEHRTRYCFGIYDQFKKMIKDDDRIIIAGGEWKSTNY